MFISKLVDEDFLFSYFQHLLQYLDFQNVNIFQTSFIDQISEMDLQDVSLFVAANLEQDPMDLLGGWKGRELVMGISFFF